ncbi:MAG: hypothetical protein WDN28_00045 [Chthoniobacter sp.]
MKLLPPLLALVPLSTGSPGDDWRPEAGFVSSSMARISPAGITWTNQ